MKIKKIISFLTLIFLFSCNNFENGELNLSFRYFWGDEEVFYEVNQEFISASGQIVSIDDCKFFITHIKLDDKVQSKYFHNYLNMNDYRDIEMKDVVAGKYSELSFVFGIENFYNTSNLYVNPPQRDMFWPEHLGGGYHYIKFDGKWKDTELAQNQPFNIHIGTNFYTDTSGNKLRKDRSFRVIFSQNLKISKNNPQNLSIKVDLKQFFENPNLWDFSAHQGGIMEDSIAMDKIVENAKNGVFTLME